jgi:hypothetical protein
MKHCPTCQISKPSTEFNINKSRKDGLQSFCRECQKIYDQSYYATRVERRTSTYERVKDRRKKKREMIWQYFLEHPCVDCNESDPVVLEFDHREQSEKEEEIGRLVQNGASVKRLFQEIDKCDVRCANCHRRRTAVQCGWYKDFLPGYGPKAGAA